MCRYSVNVGNVHVIVFSTEHDFLTGSDQYNWMAADLEAVNRTLTPWVIVTGHRYGTCLQDGDWVYCGRGCRVSRHTDGVRIGIGEGDCPELTQADCEHAPLW